MTSMSMPRSSLWAVDSRVIAFSAIGAALYGALVGLFEVPIPGTVDVDVRPVFALVPFFGYVFGPVVGFFTGLVGNMIGDQISELGALASYNWSLANGAVGLLAGLAPLYLGSMLNRSLAEKAVAGALAGSIATVIGFLIVFYDMVKDQMDFNAVLTTEYVPTVVGNLIATVILVPLLVAAWDPVRERLGG